MSRRPAPAVAGVLGLFACSLLMVGAAAPGFLSDAAMGQTKSKTKSDAKSGDADEGSPRTSKDKDGKSSKRVVKRGEGELPKGPAQYTSKNFIVNTDLTKDEANDLLRRLETMLVIISKYWAKPHTGGPITMYVVKDINKWPAGSLDPEGVDSIRGGGGITLGVVSTIGGKPVAAQAPVYATADRGTPQHEAVHAYCILNFGTTGPVWYSEGMAEMGQYWKDGDKSVTAHEGVVDYLRKSKPKSLNAIVNGEEFTGDSWQNYAWRWALCHVLANNENYASRFRPLGLDILLKKGTTFEDVYGSMAKEISFEYLFFLQHVEQGFRCDLCSWDWKAKPKLAKGSTSSTATIDATRGWQPTRALVKGGEEYQFAASGNWKLKKGGDELTADGDDDGEGKLVGVIFKDYELGEPFDLGVYGTFMAPGDGHLFVRCKDKWTELGDNAGKLTVKVAAVLNAKPLPNPKDAPRKGAKAADSDDKE